MKIVTRTSFLAMPPGTVFCKFKPMILDDLLIKGDTTESGQDFFYQEIHTSWPVGIGDTGEWIDVMTRAAETGDDLPAPDLDCESRDGLFNEDQLFIVYSAADVEAIICRLQKAMTDALWSPPTLGDIS